MNIKLNAIRNKLTHALFMSVLIEIMDLFVWTVIRHKKMEIERITTIIIGSPKWKAHTKSISIKSYQNQDNDNVFMERFMALLRAKGKKKSRSLAWTWIHLVKLRLIQQNIRHTYSFAISFDPMKFYVYNDVHFRLKIVISDSQQQSANNRQTRANKKKRKNDQFQ